MGTNARIEDEVMPQRNCEAKDEMNLAEFPLCALAHRLKPEVKTLRFEDHIQDKSTGKTIARQLTITGSDAYGLPTELDDEVLLGLLQLTRLRGFEERKVHFTRHELIRILSWRDDSKSYARIEASLNRWTGVTLYWNKAWWNKDRKCWMDEKFHILDNVWLCHRGEPAPDTGLTSTGAPQSAFVWNETIFRSFTHGNLKSIDFEFFKSLKSAVAKRLYRFLDKRFYHRNRFEMGLRELGFEHIGLSRTYDIANLKRKLLTGIRELEARGFLQPLTKEEQFKKVRAGEWRVTFAYASEQSASEASVKAQPDETLVQKLIQRGVSVAAAHRAVAAFPTIRIESQMEVFDWLVQRKDPKVSRNPAGFLMSSIKGNYAAPPGFLSASSKLKQTTTISKPRKWRLAESESHLLQSELESNAQTKRIEQFWNLLSEEERLTAESLALSEARSIEREVVERGGPFAPAARKAILNSYALRVLRECDIGSHSSDVSRT